MNNGNLTEVLTRIERELVIISTSLRLLAGEKIRQVLGEALDTNEKRQVYELTDGTRSRREIARITGISNDTIQEWWDRWVLTGLLRKDPITGRPHRVFCLQELGIKVKRRNPKKGQQNEESIG